MNIRLNLLSPDKKAKFINLAGFLFVKELLEMVIFTATILAMAFMMGWIIISETLQNLVASSLANNREQPTVNKDIRQINWLTREIVAAGQNNNQVLPKIVELATSLPAGIKLSAISLDNLTGEVTIDGTAQNRDILIDYQKVIKSLSWIADSRAPASQLLQKENINFEIRAQIKNIGVIKKNTPKAQANDSLTN